MGKFRNYLKSIDILSPNYYIEYKNSSKHKSIPGALLTIILITFILVVTIVFSRELWEKESPTIINTQFSQPETSFSLYKKPFIFSIYNSQGSNIIGFNKYVTAKLIVNYGPFSNITDPNNHNVENKYELVPCDITKEYEHFYGYDFGVLDMRCPTFINDTEAVLRNEFYSSNSTSYTFEFYKCDPTERECADDLEEIFDSIILYFSFIPKTSNPLVYSNSIVEYEENHAVYLSNNFQKNLKITFDYVLYKTDAGLLFEDINILRYVNIKSVQTEYDILQESSKAPKATIMMQTTKTVTQIQRSYLKLQELFAKIGGLINVAYILLNYISYSYLNFLYYLTLRDTECEVINKNLFQNNYFNFSKNDNNKALNNNIDITNYPRERNSINKFIANSHNRERNINNSNDINNYHSNNENWNIIDKVSIFQNIQSNIIERFENNDDNQNKNTNNKCDLAQISLSNKDFSNNNLNIVHNYNSNFEINKNSNVMESLNNPNSRSNNLNNNDNSHNINYNIDNNIFHEGLIKKYLTIKDLEYIYRYNDNINNNKKENPSDDEFIKFTYFDYALSHILCKKKKKLIYSNVLLASRKLLSLENFLNAITKAVDKSSIDLQDNIS